MLSFSDQEKQQSRQSRTMVKYQPSTYKKNLIFCRFRSPGIEQREDQESTSGQAGTSVFLLSSSLENPLARQQQDKYCVNNLTPVPVRFLGFAVQFVNKIREDMEEKEREVGEKEKGERGKGREKEESERGRGRKLKSKLSSGFTDFHGANFQLFKS